MQNSIRHIMFHEHQKIMACLKQFENNIHNEIERQKIFNDFKWLLEKHFFVEEKVIFNIYNSSLEQENEDMNSLITEHKDILYLIKKIEDSLLKINSENIIELKKTLKNHANFENEVFYPRLDEELDEQSKKLIIERCSEINKC